MCEELSMALLTPAKMLSVQQAVDFIDTLKYKQPVEVVDSQYMARKIGEKWTFTTARDPGKLTITVAMHTQNMYTEPANAHDFTLYIDIVVSYLNEEQCITLDTLLSRIYKAISGIEEHERQELLTSDGRQIYQPHPPGYEDKVFYEPDAHQVPSPSLDFYYLWQQTQQD